MIEFTPSMHVSGELPPCVCGRHREALVVENVCGLIEILPKSRGEMQVVEKQCLPGHLSRAAPCSPQRQPDLVFQHSPAVLH